MARIGIEKKIENSRKQMSSEEIEKFKEKF